jgi:hypothetical protein
MKFFKVDTNLTKTQCEDLLNSLSSIEIEELQSLDIISEDIEYNGFVTSYIICNDYTISKVQNFLDKKGVYYELKDVSYDILIGRLSLRNTEFELETEHYIKEFLTIDLVLDKINYLGIDSLTQLDKNCLKKI